RRDAFAPARASAMAARRRMPLSEAAWLDGVAAAALGRPPHWSGSAVLDLDRVAELTAAGASALDGVLGPTGLRVGVPGSQEWPLSPSVLEVLLGCPHRFLFEELLGFEEPATAPSLREIDQRSFGGLFHRAAETLYRKHGPQIAGKQGQLDAWLAEADRVAATVFADFLGEYPLIGAAVRRKEHERLRAALHDLVAFDWETGPRQFVAVERSFGPLSLSLGPHRVVVRGRIDRLDVEGRATLVRDLKTGRPHLRMGRQREPDHVRDVQIAVYGLVAGQLAREWNLPARIAVGYAYFGRAHGERAYRDDFHETLEPAARGWLELAGDLLAARAFPRTPRPDDCAWCAFRPVCGDGAYERAGRILSDAGGPLRRFAELKNLGGPEEAEE
ncbi:MAG TPA: PD-(D/E)XK nuclease family protein, partial [Candidatus Tectomicrobia bacterium]|nr:PD-(D/E)XK nuclease family protein [Candidatus Tectomicrobia bacterium]